ncbi:MAG: Na(+)-translocating NADH-quinone reductase subunit C [Planctomycetota bacterium]|nr:Na(+)-translocating NADH-quinone reductase subunit C [Planctomycetota bacterium]MDA0919574.1 Na(+)-translocating NADH-quinone reductase subunit C [Planctomycetota bacterium]MDA1158848.1 Na(+)-translocating NADH-quinone reductase subunit C [Planctomycetota bacterium]
MSTESPKQTMIVATCLCLVCSVLVSTAAVVLRPTQQIQKTLDIQTNILKVAGIYDETRTVESQFKVVEPVLIELAGKRPRISDPAEEGIDLKSYDPKKAAKKEHDSVEVSPPGALPQIARREIYTIAYEIRKDDGHLDQAILPIYGKGLWSTLYGFIAVDADGQTIRGITFYEHGETPGLGGEVENPAWKALWPGKSAFATADIQSASMDHLPTPTIQVAKGQVTPETAQADHKVDGLSGATITSNGVTALVRYWLGPDGFGSYLHQLRSERATSTPTSAAAEGETNG